MIAAFVVAAAWASDLPAAVVQAEAAPSPQAASVVLEVAMGTASEADRPWVLLYAGEAHRRAGDPDGARVDFQKVAVDYPSSAAAAPAKLGMALVDVQGGITGNAAASLALFPDTNVPPSMSAERWLALARLRETEGADPTEVRKLLHKADDFAAHAPKDVQKHVTTEADAMRERLGAGPKPGTETDEQLVHIARSAVLSGDLAEARKAAESLLARFPSSTWKAEAQHVVDRATAGAVPDASVVAVLLPSTGTYAAASASLRAAIELGTRDAGTRVTLKFHDTKGTADGCVAELRKAVIEEHAALVLGPLTKDEAGGCATEAQAWRVPMLTFTSADEPLAAGDAIFRASVSSSDLVTPLVQLAVQSRGLRRFAIAYPKTPYGENAAKAFQEAVAAAGGATIVVVPYDQAAKDFRGTARVLARTSSESHRYDVPGAPVLSAEARAGSKVDYDALFIPDGYARTALLAAALAYEDVPIGTSPGVGSRGPIALLGLNGWNSDEWPRRGGAYVRDSLFVDGFDSKSQLPGVQRFLSGWHGGSAPTVLEASAYDATRLALTALAAGGSPIDALHTVTLDAPAAGTVHAADDRTMQRTWTFFTVNDTTVVPLP